EKLKLWFSDSTALANSVSSLRTAWRTATRPVMIPRTRMVATNTHSVAISAPPSSFHSLLIRLRMNRTSVEEKQDILGEQSPPTGRDTPQALGEPCERLFLVANAVPDLGPETQPGRPSPP